ncbi:MAG: GtrA family protein [Myxococcales bacterium]
MDVPSPDRSDSTGPAGPGAGAAGTRTEGLSTEGLRTFARSNVTSLFTTALDFATLIGLTELAGVNYVVATWLGTVVGALSNFLINRNWAFRARGKHYGPQFARFLLVQVAASAFHTGGVWGLTTTGGVPYPISKAIVSVAVYLLWNYPLNRRFVFSHSRRSDGPARPA